MSLGGGSRRLLVLLGLLSAMGAFALDMYLPALPRLSDDFGVDASLGQLTLTACLAGLAVGQLVAGPLSDAFGRRPPLLAGTAVYALTSLACAFTTSIAPLVGLRFVQGAGASCGMVIGRAVVRDLHEGTVAARLYSRLLLVIGVSPVIAPLVGSQLLRLTSWRGVFVALAVWGAVLLAVTVAALPETNPPARRRRGGLRQTARGFHTLLRDPPFVGYALTAGLGTASIFAYLAGSPFVVQKVYGGSPLQFALLFGLNACGLIAGSQLNAHLVTRVPSQRLLWIGCSGMVVAGVSFLVVTSFPSLGLASIIPPLFLLLASTGVALPNATALGMARHPEIAGSASALLGLAPAALGAIVAPLVGIAGKDTALPLALVIVTLVVTSPLQLALLTRQREGRAELAPSST
jgi:DHA1 family bicyclomycin/chloramphenicol resistance-like MFS transporter